MQRLRRLAHADDPGGDAADDGVGRYVPGDDRVGPDHRVVADADAAEDAGAVADPDVVADLDVALVDALRADRQFDVDDAVVEVDEHRPVGDHALLADPHPLVGGDRALLAQHRFVADLDQALVAADLRPVANPDEAAEADLRAAPGLQCQAAAEEDHAGGRPAPAGWRQQAPPGVSPEEPQVLPGEHAVAGEEAQQAHRGRTLD